MSKFIMAIVVLFPLMGLAQSTKYFKNPIKNSQLKFESCAVEKGINGILNQTLGDVICFDKGFEKVAYYESETEKVYYFKVYKKEEETGVAGSSFGQIRQKIRIKQLGSDLESVKKARQSTLSLDTYWEYSDGGVTVVGGVPLGKRKLKSITMPLFYLAQVDAEVEQFKDELDY